MLAPIVPAASGNGLAMRAGQQLEALGRAFAVRLLVVAVAGGARDTGWAREHADAVEVLDPGELGGARSAGIAALVGRAEWRRLLAACDPLPHAAAAASPALAGAIVDRLGLDAPAPLHALRAYLAPLAAAVADAIRAPSSTIDLDDDDEQLLRAAGAEDEARAYGRLLDCFGPRFAWASLASPDEAAAVADRRGLRTVVVPNVVPVRPAPRKRSGNAAALLFVGNLTYEPNVEAAVLLARDVLPRVRERGSPDARVDLIGAFDPAGPVAGLGALAGVHVHGFVRDLAPAYARADVVVVPLGRASGTRIKVLEAFAYGVPVVSTVAGIAGIDAAHGSHLLIADGPDDLAAAVAQLLAEPSLGERLVREARQLVQTRYAPEDVGRRLVELVRGGG
jgi:glycosyltransferase involved in cell wall biosynthesis